MTIDECITDCEQVMFGAQMMKQTEVYDYNRQLAKWLRELKDYKDARVGCEYCKHNYREQHERPCSLCQRNFMDMFEKEVNADADT